ncbi:hypothetical protein AMK16_16160 [Streptomyces sp. CB00455]|uniref:hypothetical protein n=1 Tax=Streptomyces sp. CB00455 TaxID=1703927 RepID=UPI00093EAC49|nr:hypothetical protein [Streptomyces sp. CB00455]OKK19607.1 hypothetical protein AMK16_16160 [Streptomyces sp. CB00455]
MLLVRTSSRDVTKALGRSAVAVVCGLMLASCTTGEPEAEVDHPCEVVASSQEWELLREILRTDAFVTEIHNRTGRLAEKLENELSGAGTAKETLPVYSCAYIPGTQKRGDRAMFGFGWIPRASKDEESSSSKGVPYEANDAFGETSDTHTKLYVQCDMPGERGEASKSAWLYADGSYVSNIGRTDIDQTARDRQTAFTYLMARRVTEALGCENMPLEKPPVVKPVPSPSP